MGPRCRRGRIRASGGRARHGCRGWTARGARLTVGDDACGARRGKTEWGEGRRLTCEPGGENSFHFFSFLRAVTKFVRGARHSYPPMSWLVSLTSELS